MQQDALEEKVRAALAPIAALGEGCLLEMSEAQERGVGVVGLFCLFAPEELIRAAGLIPVSLCGKKEDPIAAAEVDLPPALCPLIKSSYGYAITDTCPFFAASDLIVGETTCDGKKKMFEFLGQSRDVHVMQLPYDSRREGALAFWQGEVAALRKRLEGLAGRKIADRDLREAIGLLNRRREWMRKIAWMMASDPLPLSGSEMLLVTESRNYGLDVEAYIGLLEKLYENLQEIVEAGGRKSLKGRKRILLTGCPMGKGSDKILNLLEACGAVVVVQEHCSGVKGFYRSIPETDDPFAALSRYYLDTPCACMSPNPERMALLRDLAVTFRADAVVDACLFHCHPYIMESCHVSRIMEETGLPCLHLETGYSSSDTENLRVRVEAFLEML